MKKGIINFILIIVFVAVLFLLDLPTYNKVAFLKSEIKKYEYLLKEKKELLAKVSQLRGVYESRQDGIKKVYHVLSEGKDVPNLIVQLEALASENGLILERIEFLKGEVRPAVKTEEKTGLGRAKSTPVSTIESQIDYKTLEISLKLNGEYQSFKSFLKALESNVRLMVIKSINFTSGTKTGETAAGAGFVFNVSLEVYYQ